MTGGVLGRLVSMDRAQATFRLRGELCKLRERARLALLPSRWDRRQLAADMRDVADAPHWNFARQAMARGDHHAAHCALARHFAERTSAFPLDPRDIPTLAARISAHFPGAGDDAARRASEIAAGRYTLLGHRNVRVGFPIDWHRDPVYGRRVPRVHWAAVPYLDPAFGDHKVIWELNRHQHWLAFGRAFALTGNRVHYDAFRSQLRSWLDANPPLTGTNWASMLELAIRVLSWLWALSFFSAVAQHDNRDEPPWMVDALLAIAQQLTHVERNLSLYFSPNTHLSGEALALYVAGCTLPELTPSTRWADRGREVLLQEAQAQVCEDGGHAERSTHYHRYSTDFYLLALAVARRSGDGAVETFERTARAQAVYLRMITDDDGRRPAIGDDDGGQMFPICGRDPEDCRDTLAVAAVLLDRPELAVGPAPEEAFWICGERAAGLDAERPAGWPSGALWNCGYYVSRTPTGDHLLFDAGPHGFLNGGHAHADALSVVLTVQGRPLLIDPGTATYTMDRAVRDQFRATAMHNTLMLDRRPQCEPSGPFQWQSQASARARGWWSGRGCDYVVADHAAYRPHRHTRAVLAVHGVGWWILDRVTGEGEHELMLHWHLHPSWQPRVRNGSVDLRHDSGAMLSLASTANIRTIAPGENELAVWSPAYGRVEPAPVLIARCSGLLPQTIATFVSAVPTPGLKLQVADMTHDPGDLGACGWQARWDHGSMTVLSALDTHEIADLSRRWGTEHLQTDATLAALIESHGSEEAVIVDGTGLWSDGTQRLRLAALTSLVRTPVPPTWLRLCMSLLPTK